jgi:hypothetical protein
MSKQKTIFRNARPETGFTPLSNKLLNHETLSCEAMALQAVILAKVETWLFNLAWARKRFGWGETKSQNVIRELIEEGFVRKLPQQRIARGEWGAVIYEFTDVPHTFDDRAVEITQRLDGEGVFPDDRAVENRAAKTAAQRKNRRVEKSKTVVVEGRKRAANGKAHGGVRS